jgi:hypothetical protein
MSESAVVKLGAFLYEGAKAGIGAGLADRAGDYSSAHADLAASLAAASNPALPGSAASAEDPKTPKGETNRMEPNAPATSPPTEAELAVLRAEASKQGYSVAGEVVDLCMLSGVGIPGADGKPRTAIETAAHFIREKTPIADVRKALLEAKAKTTDTDEIQPHALPGAGTDYEGKYGKPAKTLKQLADERIARAAKAAN